MDSTSDIFIKDNYIPFLDETKSKIKSARVRAYRSANKELIHLYWDIGKKIVEKQEEFGWGKKTVERLSRDLKREFSTQ